MASIIDYIPDPEDSTFPKDNESAGFIGKEMRALKQYLQDYKAALAAAETALAATETARNNLVDQTISALNDALNSETNARTTADTTLTTNVDQLTADLAALDAQTGSAITSIIETLTSSNDSINLELANTVKKAANLTDLADKAAAFNNIKQNATTTSTGVVEKATSAEMEAGTSGKFPDASLVKNSRQSAVNSLDKIGVASFLGLQNGQIPLYSFPNLPAGRCAVYWAFRSDGSGVAQVGALTNGGTQAIGTPAQMPLTIIYMISDTDPDETYPQSRST